MAGQFAGIYSEKLVCGERSGDCTFKHEYVLGLLEKARASVQQCLLALPSDDSWLICVRTYGRAGNPECGVWAARKHSAAKGVLGLTLAALEKAAC